MAIAWDETREANDDIVGRAPSRIQSIWSAIAVGLATELYWPGSGGGSQASIGELIPGGVNTFFAANSAVSNSATNLSRAFISSDETRLIAFESAGTYMLGTPRLLEHADVPVGRAWVSLSGFTEIAGAGTPTSVSIDFDSSFSTFAGVQITLSEGSFTQSISTETTGGFTAAFSYIGSGSQSDMTLYWDALESMEDL